MASLSHLLKVNVSALASSVAGWRGTSAFRPARRQPEQPLVLYEFEACPFCRLVREALTEMDLDARINPCPKGGQRFRPEVEKHGGKLQFPFLIDPNTKQHLFESADIIEYLAETYEGKARPTDGLRRNLQLASAQLSSAVRPRGMRARPSRAPEQPLELYSFESSPYSRLVREVLCELEIPYLLRSTGKSSWKDMGPAGLRGRLFPDEPVTGRNRRRLLELTGQVQVPYLVDPNSGQALFESEAIVRYLEQSYAT